MEGVRLLLWQALNEEGKMDPKRKRGEECATDFRGRRKNKEIDRSCQSSLEERSGVQEATQGRGKKRSRPETIDQRETISNT